MQLFIFKRPGSAVMLALTVLLMICGVVIYYNRYLNRQMMINRRLCDQFMAETMVRLADQQTTKFNCGRVEQMNKNEWQVTLRTGIQVTVKQ